MIALLVFIVGAHASEKPSFQTNLIAVMNATLGNRTATQLEYELHLSGTNDTNSLPQKSKVTLSVLCFFGLNLCGIDRCYLGQCCLGTVKGLTCGGLGIWFFIDWIIIICNMLKKAKSINTFGFQASFPADELDTAFWISVVSVLVKLCCGGGGAAKKKGSEGREKAITVEIDPEDSEAALYQPLHE